MKWWLLFAATVCCGCVSPVDDGCSADEDCRNGRVCEDSSCERAPQSPEPVAAIDCALETFEREPCRAEWACEGPEERKFSCTLAAGRDGDCKCSRTDARDIDVQLAAGFECPGRAAITSFVNDECGWNVHLTP